MCTYSTSTIVHTRVRSRPRDARARIANLKSTGHVFLGFNGKLSCILLSCGPGERLYTTFIHICVCVHIGGRCDGGGRSRRRDNFQRLYAYRGEHATRGLTLLNTRASATEGRGEETFAEGEK